MLSYLLCNFRNMRVLQDLTTEEILRWVEWKDVDMQYDLFNKNKFRDDPRFDHLLKKRPNLAP